MSYFFYLPNYVPYSNGIKSLWYTALLFSKHRNTIIITFNGGEIGVHEVPAAFESLINRDRVPTVNDIVIYPDMIQGNPLGGVKVARYLMAKPFILNGQGINRTRGDFLFAYSRAVDKNLPQFTTLLPELLELAKYKTEIKEKTVVVYYGKCRICLADTNIKEIIKNFDKVKIITRSIPKNKDVLYEQIASASLFVSYDPLSSLAYEANLVGTPSLLMDPIFREDFDEFNHKLPGFYYSYNDLKDKDLHALGGDVFDKSHADLISVLQNSDSQAKSIILQMESWFKVGGEGGGEFEKAAAEFYNERWSASPIQNCTSISSVIAYNLIRTNLAAFLISQILYRTFSRAIKFFSIQKLKIHIARLLYTPSEIDIIRYKIFPERRKIIDLNVGEKLISRDSIFELDGGVLSFIWRLVCR